MSDYQPGVCNIGPSEIARRRRAGSFGALTAAGLMALLVLTKAPRYSRLLVGLPAALSASGYIQARSHFCAGFGSRGVFNFGDLGQTTDVVDPEDRAIDAARSRRIGLQSAAIGIAVAGAAAALPIRAGGSR